MADVENEVMIGRWIGQRDCFPRRKFVFIARLDADASTSTTLRFLFFFYSILFSLHASPVYSTFSLHIMASAVLRPTHSLVRMRSLHPTSPSKNQLLTHGLAPTIAFKNASTATCRNTVARDTTCSTSALLPEFANASSATASQSRHVRILKVKRRIMQVLDEQTKWIMSVERRRLLLELRQHQNPYQNHYQFAYFHTRPPSHSLLPHRTFSTSVPNLGSARHPLLIPTHSFPLARTMTFPLLKRGYPGTHHIPTRAELLAQANGTLHRLRLRIKLVLMRQIRPWTLNDITAMFSWVFVGHTVWLLVGTTSCVSLLLFTANTLQFQGGVGDG